MASTTSASGPPSVKTTSTSTTSCLSARVASSHLTSIRAHPQGGRNLTHARPQGGPNLTHVPTLGRSNQTRVPPPERLYLTRVPPPERLYLTRVPPPERRIPGHRHPLYLRRRRPRTDRPSVVRNLPVLG
jgi:hypothetical protein